MSHLEIEQEVYIGDGCKKETNFRETEGRK